MTMTTSTRWVIGRSPDCDLVMTEAEVSSRHCRLSLTSDGYLLEDLGSSNGTFVNGTRISAPVAVKQSDRITLGQKVPLPWPREPAAPQARPGPPAPPPPPTAAPAGSRILRVGRAPDNDVVLDHPSVSGHHARVVVQGDRAVLEDLGSSNGTFVGQRDQRVQKAPLKSDDVVYLGSLRVPASRLLGAEEAADAAPAVSLRGSSMIFGRHPDCDQVLNYPMISGRHARLSRQGRDLVIEDLGSSNGTFVNGNRIRAPEVIRPGDAIGLGSYTFTLADGGELKGRDYRNNSALEARGLGVAAGGRMLISDVSLTIYPGEFVGLMGPSGAGKTTLMNALNGYVPPTKGIVLLNGQDLYRHYDQFRSVLGYVPQDDVMHRDLTVGQALYYSARLRLPSDYTAADIRQRIDTVLEQLGLTGTEDVLIGSAERKGISGGQRRRVNLAMELLTDPLVLFLDEPTSGLSSEDAMTVMKVLRSLADSGKTILLTIHQPSLEVYRLMDHLVLMGKDQGSSDPGRLVYFGPAYPNAVHHFNPDGIPNARPGIDPSPDEVLRGMSRKPAGEWAQRYRASAYYEEFVRQRSGGVDDSEGGEAVTHTRGISAFFQWWLLVCRLVTIKLRDRTSTAILLVQAPIVALLVAMVFGKQVTEKVTSSSWPDVSVALGKTVFLMALAALWFGASNAVREIVGEWAVYHRERMLNLRIGPYVASKFAVLGALCVIQCVTLLLIVGPMCKLEANWLLLFGMLMLSALVGTTIGLILSALARTSEVAIALLPIVLLPMVILGGALQPIHQMSTATRWVSMAVPTRWAYEGILLLEAPKRPTWRKPTMPGQKREPAQDMAEPSFPEKERTSVATAAASLLVMLGLGGAAVVSILRKRDVH
jgi:ABC-type multidrug transport system ATPase subunit/pSer/pThr/pTyr-binding forkhead associated (FHA) protein